MIALFLMLVHFKFYRCGYMAEGLVESDNLNAASDRLWKEHPGTFKWVDIEGPENENRLTVEEYNEYGSGEKVEPEAKPRGTVGL
jgi:hypothetical protein|tara:strand:+ start:900 stop:1154 length:255 start_codon:yes stop_codon:yes gene_type:complete